MKTDNSLNVNWLYSPNIKHKNHMGNIEIQRKQYNLLAIVKQKTICGTAWMTNGLL